MEKTERRSGKERRSGGERRKFNDPSYRRLKVLVVDDEELISWALSRYLLKRGYEITATNSSETAMSLIQKDKFDVIISDVMMGSISGIDLIRKLRSFNLDSKVILMSATFQWEEIKQQVEGLKLDAFIEKPFQLREFHEKLVELTGENPETFGLNNSSPTK